MSRSVDPGRVVRDLTGVEVGLASGVVRCTACGATVEAGAGLKVHAARAPDERSFRVVRSYCGECNRVAIRQPTLGMYEVLVSGRVTRVDGRFVLAEVAIRDWSPPIESGGRA